jgi:hypothetical protein
MRAAAAPTVVCLQSWVMLTLKVSKLMRLKQRWDEQRELEEEIKKVGLQLAQTADPEIAMQVEEMMLMSPRAARLIPSKDVEGLRAQAASRRFSSFRDSAPGHDLRDSATATNLVSVSPGVSGLPGGSSDSESAPEAVPVVH